MKWLLLLALLGGCATALPVTPRQDAEAVDAWGHCLRSGRAGAECAAEGR